MPFGEKADALAHQLGEQRPLVVGEDGIGDFRQDHLMTIGRRALDVRQVRRAGIARTLSAAPRANLSRRCTARPVSASIDSSDVWKLYRWSEGVTAGREDIRTDEYAQIRCELHCYVGCHGM